MKKNQKTYLLLALVLTVWGVLGFRIVKTVNPSNESIAAVTHFEKFNPGVIKSRDTFNIVANYRDPFLGTLPKSAVPKKKIAKPKKQNLPEKDIQYTGFITESTSEKKIFFISIDGQQKMFNQKDVFHGVRLLSGNAEKIKVSYHGKTKNISLTQ